MKGKPLIDGMIRKPSGQAFEKYSKEYNRLAGKYLQVVFNKYMVLFKDYNFHDRITYLLYKRDKPLNGIFIRKPIETVVDIPGHDFDGIFWIAQSTIFFRENNSIFVGVIDVQIPFQRQGVATWLIKYHLDIYYPEATYSSITAEARTPASQSLTLKLRMKKIREWPRDGFWDMQIDPPAKLRFPNDCSIEEITKKIFSIQPKRI